MKKSTGVTLIELMVTISIAAILLAAGAPNFIAMLAKNKLEAQANDFVSGLNTARSEAVLRNVRATMCHSANGTSCGGEWEDGWLVFVDDGATPGTVDVGEEIILVNDGLDHARYTLRGNNNVANRVSFGGQGYSLGFNGQLVICFDEDNDNTGDFDDQNAIVTIVSSSGRIRTLKPSHGDVTLGDCTP